MSEEEIIKNLKELISWKGKNVEIRDYEIEAIQGLLDLYNKEQEKNKRIKDGVLCVGRRYGKSHELKMVLEEYISKDKIRAKIDKLKEEKYNVNSPHCGFWYELKIETLVELLESEE